MATITKAFDGMKKNLLLLLVLTLGLPYGVKAQSLGDIINVLEGASPFAAEARFESGMTQSGEPAQYIVRLMSEASPADIYAPCRYLLEWEAPMADTTSGFTAYYDGNFYRYREGGLMQEYHASTQPWHFAPGDDPDRGVQSQTLFANLLPQFLCERLGDLDRSTVRTDLTTVDGRQCVTISGDIVRGGYTAAQATYTFDAESLLPLHWRQLSNPDAPSEQLTEAWYSYPGAVKMPTSFTDDGMAALHPDAFGPLRESTFSVENLPGLPLPAFSCRMAGPNEERMHHAAGEPLEKPTVIVFLARDTPGCIDASDAVRKAVDAADGDISVWWAFPSSGVVDYIVEPLRHIIRSNEMELIYARSLAAACRVKSCPTTILVGTDGVVKEIAVGVNNDAFRSVIKEIENYNAD